MSAALKTKMDECQKKVSFTFSKVKGKSQLVKPVEVEKKEVEYVDAFDGVHGKFSYQGSVRNDEVEKAPLVIPLVGTRSAYDVIKAKLESKEGEGGTKTKIVIKTEPETEIQTNEINNQIQDVKTEYVTNGFIYTNDDKSQSSDTKPSLDALAAEEILKNIKEEFHGEKATKNIVIAPELEKLSFEGEKESTLEDYENIPVDDFGLAMLRGMGWTPETGIGKDSKVVTPITSNVRPRRLGLGAEGAILPPGERLPLKRGSFIKVLAGQLKNALGVVEGIDGDTGSAIIKIEGIGVLSLSENIFKTISKKEFETGVEVKDSGRKEEKNIASSASSSVNKKYGINEKIKTSKVVVEMPLVKSFEKSAAKEKGHTHVDKRGSSSSVSSRDPKRKGPMENRKRRDSSSSSSNRTVSSETYSYAEITRHERGNFEKRDSSSSLREKNCRSRNNERRMEVTPVSSNASYEGRGRSRSKDQKFKKKKRQKSNSTERIKSKKRTCSSEEDYKKKKRKKEKKEKRSRYYSDSSEDSRSTRKHRHR